MPLRCSAACSPGLEALVVAELAALGVHPGPPSPGLVPFAATTRQVYAACLRSAVASRILVQVARFPARTFAALEGEAAAVDWSPWTGGNATFRVTAAK
ncbi:MAG: THUMP domain-containing protein, partial [Acidimicrobiales bacterium]